MHIAVEVGHKNHWQLNLFKDGFGDDGNVLDHLVVTGIQDGILRGYGDTF